MFLALRHRVFRRLFAAHVVALLGTGLSTIAIGFLVFDTTGGGAAGVLGTLLGIKMLTFLLLGPLAPLVARRVGTKRLLVLTDLARVGVALALPFVGDVVTAYLLIFVLQSASALFTPTFQATIPAVVSDERQYTGALALSRLAYDIEALVSPSIASVVVVVASSSALFFGTGVGFLASALLILSAALPKASAPVRGVRSVRREIAHGTRLMLRVPRLRAVLTLHLALASVGAIAMVLTLPLVLGELDGDEVQAAALLAVYGVGSITSAVLMPTMIARLGVRPYMMAGLALMVVSMAFVWPVLALASGQDALPWLWAIWFLAGVGFSAVLAPMGRVLRDAVPDDDLPDVFAAQFSLSHGWWLISYPAAGWGATLIGFGPTSLLLAAFAALALGVAAHAWRTPSLGEMHPELSASHQ
ncbi:MFS family permease [Agrococcus sp. UYP10]|uniref:MFS transporter n=1 Tax=Agrococcus sp. UYP10 TaxID=1756355 RepID=UPI003390EBE8